MFQSFVTKIIFPCLFLILLVSCTPSPVEPAVSEATARAESKAPLVDKVVPFGEPEIRDLQPTNEVVSNCGGVTAPVIKHPSITIGTSHSVEWEVGGTLGTGLEVGSDLLPAKINLNAALEGSLARDLSNKFEQENAWDLPAEPGYIMEYTVMWREVWQPGYIDATFFDPEPDIIRINVKYRTGVQSEIVGQKTTECNSNSENIVSATETLSSNTLPIPTISVDSGSKDDSVNSSQGTEGENQQALGFRSCSTDPAASNFIQTDSSTGKTRINLPNSDQVFFITSDPTTITFSQSSGLKSIPYANSTQIIILGKSFPGLEWIELDPGFAYVACIYSTDLFGRAKSEADNDMSVKIAGGGNFVYYIIDGQNVVINATYP